MTDYQTPKERNSTSKLDIDNEFVWELSWRYLNYMLNRLTFKNNKYNSKLKVFLFYKIQNKNEIAKIIKNCIFLIMKYFRFFCENLMKRNF